MPAFKIIQFRENGGNYKVLEFDKEIFFDQQPNCPADQKELRTICTLAGDYGRQKIRVGCCELCGYTGYIDRPQKEWIDKFYLNIFSDFGRDPQLIASKLREKYFWRIRLNSTERLLDTLMPTLDRKQSIGDIGCGYGFTLQWLQSKGFNNLVGVEASDFRAEAARKIYGLNIITAPFESAKTQTELAKKAPFGIMFLHQVLEHVYNPREIISRAASLQKDGDRLIIAVPNGENEFGISALLYLPHLHSFTKQTFRKILADYGYFLAGDSFSTKRELCLLFQKGSQGEVGGIEKKDYFQHHLNRFLNYFQLKKDNPAPRKLFWAFRNVDMGHTLPDLHLDTFNSWVEKFLNKTCQIYYRGKVLKNGWDINDVDLTPIFSFLMSPVEKRYTAFNESPLEIQFKDSLKMYYK